MNNIILDRTNEINYNNQGCLMKIIKYINNQNIDIEFDNGYIVKNVRYGDFKRGLIKNRFHPIIYNKGYLGNSSSKENKIIKKSYKYWYSMLQRCYDSKFQDKNTSYKDCEVCEEWLCFEIFEKWFNENYYEIKGEKMELDKDILFKGNKIYSPETCIFVPHLINILFVKSNKRRGKYVIGVYKNKNNKFTARCGNSKNKRISLGDYNTENEAFDAYKKYKEKIIKEIADKYKDKIPEKLYNAMYSWEVDIND